MLSIVVEDATFDFNLKTGLFGWINKEHFLLNVVVYGGLNTFLVNVGYLLSMHFFSPIIVMNSLLLESFLA